MNLLKKFGILIIALLLLLTACGEAPVETTAPTEAVDFTALYLDAVALMNQTPNYQLEISTNTTITVGSEIYEESYLQSVTIENHGSDNLKIATSESLTIDSTSINYKIIATKDDGYIDIDGAKFQSPFSSLNHIINYAPATLLNFGLYNQADGKETEDGYHYTFSNPYDIESWVGAETAKLSSASGSAELDAEGNLLSSEYTVSYTDDLRTVNSITKVKIIRDNISPIVIPEANEYRPIDSILAPLYLEKACVNIATTSNIESHSTSQIESDAFDLLRQQITELSISGADDAYHGKIRTSVKQNGSSGDVTETAQTHIFKNGEYTISTEPESPTEMSLTKQQYMDYCNSVLLGNILTVSQIDTANLTQTDDYILLNFTSTTDMTDVVCKNISQYLYGDNDFITSISDEVTPAAAQCYLALNKKTGLPTASGILFDTHHKINGVDHTIRYRVDTNYYLGALQHHAESSDTEQITPMLYKVSDTTGSNLWILAATQYGDERTANLTQPIYDALTQATVVLTDFSLNRKSPNTSSKGIDWDKTDPQLLDDTTFCLTVCGNLNDNSLDIAPAYWLQPVTDHTVEQQYRLSRNLNLYHSILQYATPTQKEIEVILPNRSPSDALINLPQEEQLLQWNTLLENRGKIEEDHFIQYEALISGDVSTLTPDQVSEETCTDLAEALMKYIGTDNTAFAIIDVQYLFTDKGVLALLQSEGYSVTQVQ